MTAFWFSLGISWIRWSQQAGGVSAGAFALTLKLRKSRIENMGNGNTSFSLKKKKPSRMLCKSFYAHMRRYFRWFHESIFNRTELETLLSHLKVTWHATKIFLSVVRQKNTVTLDWKRWRNAAVYPEGEGLSRQIGSKWLEMENPQTERSNGEKKTRQNRWQFHDSYGVAAMGGNLPKVRNSTTLLLGMT